MYQPKEPWYASMHRSSHDDTPTSIAAWLKEPKSTLMSVALPHTYSAEYLWEYSCTGPGLPDKTKFIPADIVDPYDESPENWEKARLAAIDGTIADLQEKIAQLQATISSLEKLR